MRQRIFPLSAIAFLRVSGKKGVGKKGRILFFLIVLSLFCACSMPGQNGKKAQAQEETSGSPYYYYLESRNRMSHDRPQEALAFLRQAVALDPDSAFLHQELTAILVRTGQLPEALESIERAWELDPEDAQTLLALAGIRQMLGHDARDVIPLYEKVIRMDPDQENVYLLLGNLYYGEKEPGKAESVYRRFIAQNPDNPNGYYYLGQLLSLVGRDREAIATFDKAIAMAPELIEPRLDRLKIFRHELDQSLKVQVRPGDSINGLLKRYLGRTSPELREQVLALNPSLQDTEHVENNMRIIMPPHKGNPLVGKIRKTYEDLVEKNPYSSELLMEYALFLWKTGSGDEARKLLAPLADGPENRDNSISMIHALLARNHNYRDAIFLFSAIAGANPDDFLPLYHLGLVYDDAGMEEEAKEIYSRVPMENPIYIPVLKHLAHMDFRAGEIEAGMIRLETAWKLDQTDFVTCSFLADVYAAEEKLEEAEKLLYTCVNLNPQNRDARYKLGTVLHKEGKIDDSIREMEILAKNFPNDAHVLNFLGYTLTEENKRLDEAEQLIRKAFELAPEDGYIVDSMGWICMKKGKLSEALLHLEKAVQLVPDDPVMWDHLGDVYLKVGEVEKARDAYIKSLVLDEDPEVAKKIEALEQKYGANSLP